MGITSFTKPIQLQPDMAVEGFSSGQPIVDEWFAKHARTAKASGSAVVYVSYCAHTDPQTDTPAGFYTLSSASIARTDISGGWLKRNAPSQVPVILLGMLGVDARYQNHGLGRMLLHDAVIRSLAAADIIGAKALVVDPTDDSLVPFYEENGFRLIPGAARMFAPLR